MTRFYRMIKDFLTENQDRRATKKEMKQKIEEHEDFESELCAISDVKKTHAANKNTGLPPQRNAPFHFSTASLSKLRTCHPDIQKIMNEVIKKIDFTVIEGARSKQTQDEYYAKGTSKVKYPNSYHNTKKTLIIEKHQPEKSSECSLAIDIAPYPINWENMDRFVELSRYVKEAAEKHNIPLDWGYDLWEWDAAHWQLTNYRR